MVDLLVRRNGKKTTPFRFTGVEVDRLLFNSSKKRTFTFINLTTLRQRTVKGRR